MPEIVFQNTPVSSKQTEIENLQTTLASLNQRILILQELLQEKDQEITDLKREKTEELSQIIPEASKEERSADETLTVVGAAIKLYKLFFPPGKALS